MALPQPFADISNLPAFEEIRRGKPCQRRALRELVPFGQLPPYQLDAPKRQKATEQHQGLNRPFFDFVCLHQQLFGHQVLQCGRAEGHRAADQGVRCTGKQDIAQQ